MILELRSSIPSPTTFWNLWRKSTRQAASQWKNWFVFSVTPSILPNLISFQFSSIDPVKINSHPGVRNDLFKRPLDQTRITDFFGGVSQVEVLGQSPANTYVGVGQATPDSELPPIPDRLPRVSAPAASTLSSTDVLVIRAQAWLNEFKATRSWISAFLLVSLFGWISVQK